MNQIKTHWNEFKYISTYKPVDDKVLSACVLVHVVDSVAYQAD